MTSSDRELALDVLGNRGLFDVPPGAEETAAAAVGNNMFQCRPARASSSPGSVTERRYGRERAIQRGGGTTVGRQGGGRGGTEGEGRSEGGGGTTVGRQGGEVRRERAVQRGRGTTVGRQEGRYGGRGPFRGGGGSGHHCGTGREGSHNGTGGEGSGVFIFV